jgi:hypothetical protein
MGAALPLPLEAETDERLGGVGAVEIARELHRASARMGSSTKCRRTCAGLFSGSK